MEPLILGTLGTFMTCKRMAIRLKTKARRLACRKRYRHYFVFNQLLLQEMRFFRSLTAILRVARKPLTNHELVGEIVTRELFECLPQILQATEELGKELSELKERWEPHQSLIGFSFKRHLERCSSAYQKCKMGRGIQVLRELKEDAGLRAIEARLQQIIMDMARSQRGSLIPQQAGLVEHFETIQRHFESYLVFLLQYQSKLTADHPERHELSKLIDSYRTHLADIDGH